MVNYQYVSLKAILKIFEQNRIFQPAFQHKNVHYKAFICISRMVFLYFFFQINSDFCLNDMIKILKPKKYAFIMFIFVWFRFEDITLGQFLKISCLILFLQQHSSPWCKFGGPWLALKHQPAPYIRFHLSELGFIGRVFYSVLLLTVKQSFSVCL